MVKLKTKKENSSKYYTVVNHDLYKFTSYKYYNYFDTIVI